MTTDSLNAGARLKLPVTAYKVKVAQHVNITDCSPVDSGNLSRSRSTVTFLTDMNAFLDRFHNLVLPFVRGEDGVCSCTCGREQVYHVVPYQKAQSTVDSSVNYFVSDVMTKQEIDMIAGLLLGLCISWFLLWLVGVWHLGIRYWRANLPNDVGFLSWLQKFSYTRDLLKRLLPKHTEDTRGNMGQIRQDVNGSVGHRKHKSVN